MNYNNQRPIYRQQKNVQMSQPLTPEKYNIIKNKPSDFNLSITDEDVYRAICTHKHPVTKEFTLVENRSGGYGDTMCTTCYETFNLRDRLTEEEVQGIVNDMNDVLQTIKALYVNMPEATIEEFFQIIPLIKKVPQLYSIAMANFSNIENSGIATTSDPWGFESYHALSSGYDTRGMAYGATQQPPLYQGVVQQQPPVYQMDPGMVQQQPPLDNYGNPFGNFDYGTNQGAVNQQAPQQQMQSTYTPSNLNSNPGDVNVNKQMMP